jgi:hypothetical protein
MERIPSAVAALVARRRWAFGSKVAGGVAAL